MQYLFLLKYKNYFQARDFETAINSILKAFCFEVISLVLWQMVLFYIVYYYESI